jgi:putative ABC transport system permease protein
MYFLTFVLKNLTRRPIRTALTVLGLAVAVGSMIALLGISHNVERGVAESFERRGVDLVAVQAGYTLQTSSDLDQKLVERVKKLPGVVGVDAALVDSIDVLRRKSTVAVMLFGWTTDNFGYEDLKIVAGRRLAPGDKGKAILGINAAQTLEKSIGGTITLSTRPYEVVGIFESFSVFENGAVIVPLEEAQSLMGRTGRITGFSIRVKKTSGDPNADIEAVRQEVLALTNEAGESYRLSVQTISDYVQSASHIRLTKAMVWMVSVIAIIIGVISMLNTMAMSVLERTQEIGILRAVGWTRLRVIRMVLWEAVMLGLAAAAVGTVGAIITTHVLAASPRVSGFIEPGIAPIVIAQGVGLTILIGLLGGAYPAFRAARLLPTEAIRHD